MCLARNEKHELFLNICSLLYRWIITKHWYLLFRWLSVATNGYIHAITLQAAIICLSMCYKHSNNKDVIIPYAASLVQAFQQLLVLCCLVQAMNHSYYAASSFRLRCANAPYELKRALITNLMRSKLLIHTSSRELYYCYAASLVQAFQQLSVIALLVLLLRCKQLLTKQLFIEVC